MDDYMIKIREVQHDDLQNLIGLFLEFGEGKADYNQMVSVFNNYKDNPNYIYLCADMNGNIIGNATGIICSYLLNIVRLWC